MTVGVLQEIGLILAQGYPSQDTDLVAKELIRVLQLALPSLALRAASVKGQWGREVEEVWKAIRKDSEELFAPALEEVERAKVIYVASKFMNNEAIGELLTKAAIDRSQEEEG